MTNNAISKIKNQFGSYDLYLDINPLDFDSTKYYIFDETLPLPNCDFNYFKPILDRKIIEFSDEEKTNPFINDFDLINDYWQRDYYDYKQARTDLNLTLIAKGGFDSLDLNEQIIVSKWFLVTEAQRQTVLTLEEEKKAAKDFLALSRVSRELRFDECIVNVLSYLESADIVTVKQDIKFLYDAYEHLGIEGTVEGDGEGLFDYIDSRVGTSYEFTGLRNKSFTVNHGYTINQLCDLLLDILKNGVV